MLFVDTSSSLEYYYYGITYTPEGGHHVAQAVCCGRDGCGAVLGFVRQRREVGGHEVPGALPRQPDGGWRTAVVDRSQRQNDDLRTPVVQENQVPRR